MHLTSLAWRTDLALLEQGGSEVTHHDDHVVVRTPGNPSYYWGNFVLVPRPPGPGEVDAWLALLERTFPGSRHRAIGVDGTDGRLEDLAPLAAAGLEPDVSTTMTATAVHPPPRPNTEADVRPLTTDDDWEQQLDFRLQDDEGTPAFVVPKVAAERSLVEGGAGRWYGAFLDGRLVSSLGLVEASPGLGRFQQVMTLPEVRGRGLAGTLVHAASRWALEERGLSTLVMVADPGYLAIRVYRSVGFADTETQLMALRTP